MKLRNEDKERNRGTIKNKKRESKLSSSSITFHKYHVTYSWLESVNLPINRILWWGGGADKMVNTPSKGF